MLVKLKHHRAVNFDCAHCICNITMRRTNVPNESECGKKERRGRGGRVCVQEKKRAKRKK